MSSEDKAVGQPSDATPQNTSIPPKNGDQGNQGDHESPQNHTQNLAKRTSIAEEVDRNPNALSFPVVGVGASAGGLKAFEQFIKALPADSGMAFVLVQHLAPHHESELAELLQNHTSMAVNQIQDNTELEPNCIYVIPPGKSLEIRQGVLYLQEPKHAHGHRTPIDGFFRSLAEDQGENALCIILSGTGSDGTLGLKAIKERAGVTMAQSPEDADYDGMPLSAIRTSLVDVTGTASELAQKLVAYRDSAKNIQLPIEEEALSENSSEVLSRIFAQLRSRTGHDFTHYKRSTILRRIGRRLQVNGIVSMQEYLDYLRNNPDEVQALFKDFLISVTNFFRDSDSFVELEQRVLPQLFEGKNSSDQVRVWVAGCATGEEAYSLAILLAEQAAQMEDAPEIQIFATDIDEQAIAFAREGFYNEAIAADISPERLTTYFIEERGGYRVKKMIREAVLFAIHNLANDPPFSRLNLISCRNLLIYLNRDVQGGVFEIFHYALRPGGYLFLGSSESAEGTATYFSTLDKKHRIYQRQDNTSATLNFPVLPLWKPPVDEEQPVVHPRAQHRSLEDIYREWRLRRYTPPAILVNEQYDLVHTFGDAGRYLRVKEGPATHNILEQILPVLRLDLRTALYQAFQKNEHTVSRRLAISIGEQKLTVRMHVGKVEIEDFPDELVEIVIEEVETHTERLDVSADGEEEPSQRQLINQLDDELQQTRERLQTTIEEHETSNEELKASNEELQSMNEELQSTTEELETGKEELQSMNEELVTVNQELKNKIEELSRANSDLQNLMVATDIGTIFLDRNLNIKRFTPRIQDLFNILPSDVGRPFLHVSHKINYDGLPEDAARSLRDLMVIETELESKDARWFIVRILPYRTMEDQIDGVVLTFVEITELKQSQQSLARREQQQATVAELGQLALQTESLEVLFDAANQKLCETLELQHCDLLKLEPQRDEMMVVAGVGWQADVVGKLRLPVNGGSQLGYLLTEERPIFMPDLADEFRFTTASHLSDHQIRSGLIVEIPGIQQSWGALGAYSTDLRDFSEDDAHFLQAIANLLAEAITREAAHAQIRLNEERFRIALDAAPITVFNQDCDLVYTWVYNPAQSGPEVYEIIGKRDEDLMERKEDAERLTALKQQVVETEEGVRQEVVLHFGGEERYFDVTVEPLYADGDTLIGITCASTDITEIKRAEQILRTSEDRLRVAVRNTGLSISHVDQDLRYTWIINPQHRFPITEIIGKTDAELLGQDLAAQLTALKRRVIEEGTGVHDEITMEMPDGRRTWSVTIEPLKEADGTIVGVTTASLEITSRREAEKALQVSEANLALALEAGDMGIWKWEIEQDQFQWNEIQYRLMGMTREEGVSRAQILTQIHPEDRVLMEQLFEQIINTATAAAKDGNDGANSTVDEERSTAMFELEYRILHPDDHVHWLLTRGALRKREDQTHEFVTITFDITAKKNQEVEMREFNSVLEQRVQNRTAELERSNDDLEQFAYVASHDLRAPLRAIRQLTNWLVEDLGETLPNAAQEHINRIQGRVQRMERMLEDLLVYSKIERNDDTVAQTVNLQSLIVHVLDTVVPPDGVTVHIAEDLPTVNIVYTPLELVLRNLVTNAIKHHDDSDVQIWIAATLVDDHVEFTVRDDGPGIDPLYHERIFGLFQTLQSRDQIEGSGMGLAIVRKIVRQYNGTIVVESKEGQGATFRLTWPIMQM